MEIIEAKDELKSLSQSLLTLAEKIKPEDAAKVGIAIAAIAGIIKVTKDVLNALNSSK